MTQYARPASDITNSTWTTAPTGGQALYLQLNESSPSDTNYIRATGNSQTCEVKLSAVNDPLSSSGHILRLRAKATGSSTAEKWTVTLYQGSTLKATAFSASNVTRTTFNDYTYTLSAAEADAISDYSDLRVRITVTQAAGETIDVSYIVLDVPDITPVTVTVGAAALTAAGQTVTVVPGAVSATLAAAALSAAGQTVTATAVLPDHYEIQRHPGDNNWATIANPLIAESTYDDSASLVNATTYTYRIRTVVSGVEGAWSNEVSVTYASGTFVTLNAAGLTAGAQAVSVQAGAVTVTLGAAALTAGAQAVTAVPGARTVSINAANITAAGQGVTPVPGAVTVTLNAAGITASGQTITPAPGAVSVSLNAAAVSTAGQGISVTAPAPGSVTVSLNAATLTASGQQVTPVPGAVSTTLTAAGITAAGQSTGVQVGAVTVSVSTAGLQASGQTVTASAGVIPPTTVTVNAAGITATGQAVSASVVSNVTVMLNAATIAAIGQSVTVVPGAKSVTLSAASLTTAAQTASAVPGAVSVLLNEVALTAAGRALSVVPGAVSVALQAASLQTAGQVIFLDTIQGKVKITVSDALVTAILAGAALRYGIALASSPAYRVDLADDTANSASVSAGLVYDIALSED